MLNAGAEEKAHALLRPRRICSDSGEVPFAFRCQLVPHSALARPRASAILAEGAAWTAWGGRQGGRGSPCGAHGLPIPTP